MVDEVKYVGIQVKSETRDYFHSVVTKDKTDDLALREMVDLWVKTKDLQKSSQSRCAPACSESSEVKV